MSTNTESEDGEPGELSNPDMAAAVEQDSKERKQDREQELSEAQRAAQKISERQAEKTIHLRVNGERVPFHVLGGALNKVEDTLFELRGKDEEDLTEEEAQKEKEALDHIDHTLAEKCKWEDESLGIFTFEWWREEFDRTEREEFVGDLMEGGIEGNRQ